MPVYPYDCDICKDSQGNPKRVDVFKSMENASSRERCSGCCGSLRRVYSNYQTKVFKPFFDPTYGVEVTSERQDRALMRKHGHVESHDIYRKKYEAQIKHSRWKERKPVSVIIGDPKAK